MAKENLKRIAFEEQGGVCVDCGKPLGDQFFLSDTHRFLQRKDGGSYERENYDLRCPECHFKKHGILRVRVEKLAELKRVMDSYRQAQKLRLKINNQRMAVERGVDHLEPDDEQLFTGMSDQIAFAEATRCRAVEKWFNGSGDDPFISAIRSVRGVGPISAAELLTDIDLTKAEHASSLWKYVGYDTSSIDRYQKGKAGGGNQGLRTALYNLGCCFIKCKSSYSQVYYDYKSRLEKSEKITRERRRGDGKVVEIRWQDTMPIHRHLAALRKMMKAYLADYWFVGRTILGLPTDPPYAIAQLGHEGPMVDPRTRGWVF
jgi:hypothetical protein